MSTTRRASADLNDRKRLLQLEQEIHPEQKHRSGGELRVHLTYPNTYWVAMSNLGFQAVYSLFRKEDSVVIERAFLPDAVEKGEAVNSPLKTFESDHLLHDCDLLGFSLSFETDYPHMVKMLGAMGLLFENGEQRAAHADSARFGSPLIIVGGTAVTLNPEPVADLVDLIFLGEAEEFIPEIVATLRAGRGLPRIELLKELSKLEGIYVPQFYRPKYLADDSVSHYEMEPEFRGQVPSRPARRFVKDISKFPTYTQVLTPETEFKSMFLTETGRGCEMGCRFCVAGYIYRPVRKRSEESIADTVKIGLEKSNAVGFVGASVSSHKGITKLARSVAESGGRASLSSIMAQKVSPALAASLSESEYKTVALAPEAGSERLRRAAGKRVSNPQFIQAVRDLAEAGIRGFKLYFIVGLPTERDEDVDAIAELSIAARNLVVSLTKGSGSVGWVSLSVNPFIPKACTPFQWEPMLERRELERKIDRIKKLTKMIPNLELRFEPPKESYFQALLSRGDRRVTKLLLLLESEGKDWKWLLAKKSDQRILDDVPALDFYAARRIPYGEFLPWEVVDSRIEKSLLEREAKRAHQVEAEEELYSEVA